MDVQEFQISKQMLLNIQRTLGTNSQKKTVLNIPIIVYGEKIAKNHFYTDINILL
jgi:hypothetical protein